MYVCAVIRTADMKTEKRHYRPSVWLQEIIDHSSFYALFGGKANHLSIEVAHMTFKCMAYYNKKIHREKDNKVLKIGAKYLEYLQALKLDNQIAVRDQIKTSAALMKRWEEEVQPFVNYPAELEVNGELMRLNFDFNLMCAICDLEPGMLLSYFKLCIDSAEGVGH